MVFALVALASSAEISFVLKEIDTCFNQQREKLRFLQVPHCQVCQMCQIFSYLQQYPAETNAR